MDFSFSQEQEMLRDSVARFLEKNYDFDTRQTLVTSDDPWSGDVWAQFAELGLLALPFPEEIGGLGGSLSDCFAFAQSLGEHLVVEPYVPSIMLGGAAIALSGHESAAGWVEKLGSGEAVAAFAYEEGHGTANPSLVSMSTQRAGDGYTLTGKKRHVVAGAQADILVVTAKRADTGKLALFLVDKGATGITIAHYQTIDGKAAANITFDDVALGSDALLIDDAEEAITQIIHKAIIVQSAEAVGAMKALLTITAEYAMTRKQFGQPIGAFQTVAHRLSDMKIAYTKALATLTYTTALADSGAVSPRDLSVLKGQLGKLGREIGEAAIQTHGGVGMTDELNVSHYHKRLLAYDAQFGDHTYHLRMVGKR